MTVFTEARHPVAFILSEAAGYRSREAIKIPESQTIQPGQVLAAKVVVADATATPTAAAGNTGNATIAMGSPELTSTAKNGRYKGIAVTATTVRWEDPDGNEIGTSTHGSAMTKGGIKIQITAGGNANVAGDEFYVDVGVEPVDYEFVPYSKNAVDGSQVAVAIAMYPAVTGVGETMEIAGFVRDGEVNAKELVLPDGLSAAETADLYGELAKVGIIVRN